MGVKLATQKKQVKAKFSGENAAIWWCQYKILRRIQMSFFTFLKVLGIAAKFQVSKWHFCIHKKKWGVISPAHPLTPENTLLGIGLIELTDPFHTLNYKRSFWHYTLQIILHVFLLLIFVWNKSFLFWKMSRI